MDKDALRAQNLKVRAKVSKAHQEAAALQVITLFLESAPLMKAGTIAAYQPIRGELDPRPLIEALRQKGKAIALPSLENNAIVFRLFKQGDALVAGAFGILEPPRTNPVLSAELVLLPCLGFDRRGMRLGYGAGHYDRALANSTALKVGLAFACQELEAIPKEPHDIGLDAILTESGVILF